MRLRALAPGKVNLSLFLGPTRSDGRHELVTVFQSLSLADSVELEVVEGATDDAVICAGVTGENLAARALAALRQRGWDGPRVTVSIEKAIPVAAGMAGGSADAAATLRLAMAIAPGRAEEVEAIAAGLGADVPGQLLPGLSLGTGAGEIVEQFPGVGEVAFAVVPSREFALSTADVFRQADRLGLPRSTEELAQRYAELVVALGIGDRLPGGLVVNDLEPAAISLCPWCGEALDAVRTMGADQAIVSGSGPTVVGIWWGDGARLRASDASQTLAARFPGAVAVEPVDAQFALPSLNLRVDRVSNDNITYLVGAGCVVIGLAVFIAFVVAPALQSHRRAWERVAVIVLSGYLLAAFAGLGVVLGAWIILQWPNWF